MYFMEEEAMRGLERMMRGIPNFAPRGQGMVVLHGQGYHAGNWDCQDCAYHVGRGRNLRCGLERCICLEERIRAGMAACREILTEVMANVRYPPLLLRLDQYLTESGERPMGFKNEKHRAAFAAAVEKQDAGNYKLMAALYLLTADGKLWNTARHAVERDGIRFGSFRPRGTTENGYTLYCAAKDLYLGTRNLTIGDLADRELIPPKLFGLIVNAMAVRRFGPAAVNLKERKEDRMEEEQEMEMSGS